MKKINTVILTLLFLISPIITNAQWIDVSNNLPQFIVGLSADAISGTTAIVSIRTPYEADFPCRPLFLTTNSGNTWNNIQWPGKDKFNEIEDVSMNDENNIWIATDDGKILRTTDGGTNWTVQFEDATLAKFMNYIEMFDINNGVAMGDAPYNNGHALFLTTSNGGQTWTTHPATIGRFSGDTWRRIDFVNPNVGYFYESGINPQKLYKTTDGCQSWTVINNDVKCQVLKAYDENTLVVCNSNYPSRNSFFRTFNGGNNWCELLFTTADWGNDIEFCPGDQSKIWYTDGSNVYFSADTGNTWTLQMTLGNEDSGRDIEFLDENCGWILTDIGVFHTTNGGVGITEAANTELSNLPEKFSLSQNYPNPFNPTTIISYRLSAPSKVQLKVFDLLGNEVSTLVNQYEEPGEYEIEFNASQLPSGVYFYRIAIISDKLTAGDFSQTRKMMLMK